MSSSAGPLEIAQLWLQQHAKSTHTNRKYDAQFQQFCEWALLKGCTLETVQVRDIDEYLHDVANGRASARSQSTGIARSNATVQVARSVLRSLFDALIQGGIRTDNPARLAALPSRPHAAQIPRHEPTVSWLETRKQIIAHARTSLRKRVSLWRAIAIAELATWSGLRRSELAAGSMADLIQIESRWWIQVRRFGDGATDLVEVPPAAMEAVTAYRTSRGLSSNPTRTETNVPLISSLHTERSVDPWTIAHSLSQLAIEEVLPRNARLQTIVAMRRTLASEAIKARLSADDVAHHLRSRRVVDQVSAELFRQPIPGVLDRLERRMSRRAA